ncbi:hypothetical protein [Chryseobacterium sp. ISL-6]|uniref:hypothetical protein n=1 Tax=Chryseobacterium sp. ISL-6 TaxID=2819143 RepID=UPI001BE75BBC|nr:hypothetical protein [Chryseobacterium sp. ISL-6]MBT2621282.1 hypothetical protein [Chryseobacterium sp. ISL-6]
MKFKLSKYIILSDTFKEGDDDKKISKILFSSRKKMGIKIHAGLIDLLNKGLFDKLPDNIFSMLMHYEIIIPQEENEELYLLNLKKVVLNHNSSNRTHSEDVLQQGSLYEFLNKEHSKLLQLIHDGISYDFLDEEYNMSLIYVQEKNLSFIPIDEPDISKNYHYYKEMIEKYSSKDSFLLPIDQYKAFGEIKKEDLDLIIENFKLMLLLKYKIITKHD